LDNVVAYRTGQPSTKVDFVLELSRGEGATKFGATTRTESNSLKIRKSLII
jgi:hypothetical protein